MNLDLIHFYDRVSAIALNFPGVIASTSYGTPAFKVGKKLIARFWEDGCTLVVYTEDRPRWIKKNPAVFYFTEHYRNYPWVLIQLQKVRDNDLKKALAEAWSYRTQGKYLNEK